MIFAPLQTVRQDTNRYAYKVKTRADAVVCVTHQSRHIIKYIQHILRIYTTVTAFFAMQNMTITHQPPLWVWFRQTVMFSNFVLIQLHHIACDYAYECERINMVMA